MSYSDEVAEDYRLSLEDLTLNSRYEISNLTVIAKENTEHALAISDALKNHIKRTAPTKKLPAFYVLDSVVKNVGTPYTIFLGRNLYSTFMEAYALVDNNVRRKMEEMLKTWKEPVPGSISSQPVFPADITRPIESALIKARTSALQAQQEYARTIPQPMMRGRPGMVQAPYRQTPTPPNAMRPAPFPQPGYPPAQERSYHQTQEADYRTAPYGHPQFNDQAVRQTPDGDSLRTGNGQVDGYSLSRQQYPRPASATPSWQQPHQQGTVQGPDASLDTLNSDIERLINVARGDFTRNMLDTTVQTRLKALLDLQKVLQTTRLPPDQIAAVRAQVDALSATASPQPPKSAPVPQPAPQSQPPTQGPTLSSLLGQNGLAALLARSQADSTPRISTPPPAQVQPVIRSPQPPYSQPYTQSYTPVAPPVSSAPPAADPNALFEKLRAAGLLPGAPTPTVAAPVALPNALSGTVPPGFPPSLPFLGHSGHSRSASGMPLNDVELKPMSLKIPRPHLISQLYERLGVPCTQCGRRFQSDEEGKKKKTAHMDWHFRVHLRMAEAEKRGQHRSWYVDELDWIKSAESADDHLASDITNGITSHSAAAAEAAKPKLQYIPVPENPPNTLCPICQEKFEMKWLDDAQEFVWMDAVEVGGRIYHASCYGEAKLGEPRGTPEVESVLGKRKNEEEHFSLRTKIKTEPGL